MIPGISSAANGSLARVSAIIHQDCLEDEYFQPTITLNDSIVNTGLWTRFPHDPKGLLNNCSLNLEPDFTRLQCRKRLLAQCLKSKTRFIVALYNSHESEEEWEKYRQEVLKMNSLHDFIGVLEHAELECEPEEPNLPVLHVIKASAHSGHLQEFDQIETISEIRSKLMSVLTGAFSGSEQAAEAMLMSLVSRPAMRVNGLVDSLFIGKFTLNVCVEQDTDASDNLFALLKQLKPFVAGPIKISNNPANEVSKAFAASPLYPRFDSQTGHLSSSVLQQPDGCVLVVDETGITTGDFKDQAVVNLQALIDLIRHQQVNYDFGMQQVAIKTEMPVVLVSKSAAVLPCDYKVSCQAVRSIDLSPEDSLLFSSYLEYCRQLNCQIDEEMAKFLEQDYIALRKASPLLPNGNPKMNEQELHRLINFARLRSISNGSAQLDRQIWEETKARYL